MFRYLSRAGLCLALLLAATVATLTSMAPAPAPAYNICGDDDCICPASLDHWSNPDIHAQAYVTYCGIAFGAGKNGCCKVELPGLECKEKQCLFFLSYCATATPGTILAWVARLPGQTTDQAIAAGQFVIEGPATNVNTEIKLNCGQQFFYELWAYNPGLNPTTVMLDSFDVACGNCPAGG